MPENMDQKNSEYGDFSLADKVIRAFCIVREFLSTLSSLSVRSTLNFVIVKVFTFYVKYILLIASY